MTTPEAEPDPNRGRRFLVFLKSAIVHKKRRAAGELPFQYFEPSDVDKLVKLKTARLATPNEIRRAYHADARGEACIVPAEQLTKPQEMCTGIAPDNIDEEEPAVPAPPAIVPPAASTKPPEPTK